MLGMFPTALVLHAFRAAMSHTEKLSALHAMQHVAEKVEVR